MSAPSYIERLARAVRDGVPASALPDTDGLDDLFVLYALLVRVKGPETTQEDVHDAWVVWKTLRGEDHEALKPFAELDLETRREDAPYVEAIRRAAGGRHA